MDASETRSQKNGGSFLCCGESTQISAGEIKLNGLIKVD
jgi:hypothetical protein